MNIAIGFIRIYGVVLEKGVDEGVVEICDSFALRFSCKGCVRQQLGLGLVCLVGGCKVRRGNVKVVVVGIFGFGRCVKL